LSLILAEIDLADVLVNQQRLAGVLEHDLADLQDIAVIGERKRRLGVLPTSRIVTPSDWSSTIVDMMRCIINGERPIDG
jgi:hypothetical protein